MALSIELQEAWRKYVRANAKRARALRPFLSTPCGKWKPEHFKALAATGADADSTARVFFGGVARQLAELAEQQDEQRAFSRKVARMITTFEAL